MEQRRFIPFRQLAERIKEMMELKRLRLRGARPGRLFSSEQNPERNAIVDQ
jgi:hypothetical protein